MILGKTNPFESGRISARRIVFGMERRGRAQTRIPMCWAAIRAARLPVRAQRWRLSLAAAAHHGTETDGSISVPVEAPAGYVGIKPTVGLVPRTRTSCRSVPNQNAAGPMALTVADAARCC